MFKINKRIYLTAILTILLLCCVVYAAQAQSIELSVDQFRKMASDAQMRFEDYKTINTFNGVHHRPILDTRFNRMFRTVLTNAAKEKPNFDGRK
jgi:predicted RND superfamily exporter protein